MTDETECEVCGKRKLIIAKSLSGRAFCSLNCIQEFIRKTGRQSLDFKILLQPIQQPKTRFQKIKAVLTE